MQYLIHLDDAHRAGVLELVATATDFDGVPPIAEHVLLHLRHGGDKRDFHIIICDGPTVIAYAHLDLTDEVEGPSVELVIHPAHRSASHATDIITKALEVGGARTRLWSHGDLPESQELAAVAARTTASARPPTASRRPVKPAATAATPVRSG